MTETMAMRVSMSCTLHILQSEIMAGLSMWWTARAWPEAISFHTSGSCQGSKASRLRGEDDGCSCAKFALVSSNVFFPLTPALSRGEREHLSPFFDKSGC